MSCTEMYKVTTNGDVEEYAEFGNAFLGAFNVWREMSKHYLGFESLHDQATESVWGLWKSHEVPMNDRIVMASTFDRVMVRRESLPRLIEAIRDFSTRFSAGHLLQQADTLERLAQDDTCYAVCWNQTSVNSNPWMTITGEIDEYGDEVYRPYNVFTDLDHWFLFEEIG